MINIPTGKVTFLFTDIEGSTKLAQEFPDTLQIALEKHNSIMYNAVESNNNGFVFEIVGDAFCCAFENAADAVRAAVDAQINLANEKWEDAVIKIRIGIHSGSAEWNGKYIGYITLARTARIMSTAYGEQILISNNTYELVKEKLTVTNRNESKIPSGISFRDLGERKLKNLKQPIKLFQILSPELASDFPPLKTLDARPNNLPVQLTSFIGREEEMIQVKNLLKNTHLLTVTGAGGSGKTRLALQIAADVIDDFENGVWFVELASVFDPLLLPQVITKALGIQEQSKQSLEDVLKDYLQSKEMLIILDNCEHIIEPCVKLMEKLLSNSPGLKIIATSREELRSSGEITHRVLSLEVPDLKKEISLDKLSQYEAVRLFIERALAVNSNFKLNSENAAMLARICYRLDGIPLAIELAAAKAKILSIEKINERLGDRFKLLTEGNRTALPRHQTLRALIDWSYDLLSQKEKILWSRLSVFAGGWTINASEEICSDEKLRAEEVFDLLNALGEKSIIIYDTEEERYRMLETIRQYGEEKLKQTKEQDIIFANHLKYYMNFVESAEPELKGAEIQIWLKKLDAENDNFEKALLRSLNVQNNEESLRLAGALGSFWEVRGYYSGGRRWLESVLFNSPEVINSARAKALYVAGNLTRIQGEYEESKKLSKKSLAIRLKTKDKQDIANSLQSLGHLSFIQEEYGEARKFYEESLNIRRRINDKGGIASSLNSVGNVTFNQGQYELALKLHKESLGMKREIGDKRGIAFSLINLGNAAFEYGDFESASEFYKESLTICRELGDKRGIASCLINYGNTVFLKAEFAKAGNFYEESLTLKLEIGDKLGIANSYYRLGNVAFEQGHYVKARKLYEKSLTLNQYQENKKEIVNNILGLAAIQNVRGHHKRGAVLLGYIEENIHTMKMVFKRQEKIYHDRKSSVIREKLSEEEFFKCMQEGRSMKLQSAIELALKK
jgi:predicted ATPase/class 3 adenylate cyclase